MGKKGGKKATEAKAPKCICEDPYKCQCGNRPERPSRGHKWDPVAQQWGGKGHKQKGASGQTSSVAVAAKTTAVGKTKIEQWQKLPSKLLDVYCRKEKRPNPKYKSLDRCKDGCFKYRVIIQDAKVTKRGGDHDMFFVPATEVQNEEQAREEAALLALLHLTPTLPHERTLPEPYKTTWLNALEAKKEQRIEMKISTQKQIHVDTSNIDKNLAAKPVGAASSNLIQASTYTSIAQKRQQMDAKKKERNARIRKHEALRMANRNAQVFMSAQIRQQIESFLRGDIDKDLMNALAAPEDTQLEDDDEEEEEDFVKSYVIGRLSNEGFSKSQARTSVVAIMKSPPSSLQDNPTDEDSHIDSVYEECLQWLCVHLDENQLPEGFDPRGRTLDVVMPNKSKKNTQTDSPKGADDKPSKDVQALSKKFGLTIQEAALLASSSSEKNSHEDLLWEVLVAAVGQSKDSFSCNEDLSPDDIQMNEQMASDEIEVLQSMFVISEDLFMKTDGGRIEIKITIPSLLDESESKKKILNIIYEKGGYPSVCPKVFVTGPWKEGSGTVFHLKLVEFLFHLPRGEPMIFELFGYVQELLTEDESSLAEQRTHNTLIPFMKGGRESLECTKYSCLQPNTSASKKLALPKGGHHKTHRRPREKSFFWSKKPHQTPPATAFPKLSTLMETARKRLPAAKARSEFLSVMQMAEKENNVVLVTGETGCGKTTQIPQFILEESPDSAKIVVAQPRRLAATGVADRVSKERGEEKAGTGSVGYVVRGDVAMCKSTRLMFCTTGVLMRQLQSEGALDCVTHIVIDEVHERHLDTDVLLGILKQSKPPHLKVVLMSATMDADRFAAFWGPATPRMHIPGFTHPVKDFTLEDVLEMTGYVPPKKIKKKVSRLGNKGHVRKQSPWNDSEKSDEEENDSVIKISSETLTSGKTKPLPLPAEDLVQRVGNDVDYDLIAILVRHLVETKEADDDGSILVFLPGAPEINRAKETILKVTKGFGMNLLPLHGGLQPKEQQRVFHKAEKGITKVILSTNVAETSITIPDCTMVIDTCKEKQSSYDPFNRMPLLLETFASRDSLKQRRGRAGRVRPGTCYKLISKEKWARLPEHGEPEIKRCALDQTLLSLLFLGIEQTAGMFLSKLLDPPAAASIDAAVYSLEKLGAISMEEKVLSLTPLGMHLAAIPAPPAVGKMLVMGSLLGCRSASLALAAGMSLGKSPFLQIRSPPKYSIESDINAEKEEAKNEMILQERKKVFENVGNSDLALLAAVYMKCDSIKGGGGEKRRFCECMGLAINGIRDMKQLVNQLDDSLSAAGFTPSKESDQNGNSWRIIRSCIVSALAPAQIVRVQRPSQKYAETVEGAVQKEGKAKELKFYTRSESKDVDSNHQNQQINTRYHGIPEERVYIHPSSANFSVGDYSCPWIVYHNLVRTSKPFLRDAHECNIYDLLLFGGRLKVSAAEGIIVIDEYVRLSANARIGALIRGLRAKVDDILRAKVANPTMDLAASVEMKLIVKMLRTDGLGR